MKIINIDNMNFPHENKKFLNMSFLDGHVEKKGYLEVKQNSVSPTGKNWWVMLN